MKIPDRGSGRHLTARRLRPSSHRRGFAPRRLAPLGGGARRLARPVEIGLDRGGFERNQRRAAVDDTSDPGPMTSPKVVTRERWPRVMRHGGPRLYRTGEASGRRNGASFGPMAPIPPRRSLPIRLIRRIASPRQTEGRRTRHGDLYDAETFAHDRICTAIDSRLSPPLAQTDTPLRPPAPRRRPRRNGAAKRAR